MSNYKRFPSVFRGYDPKAVEGYLQELELRHNEIKSKKKKELEELAARREELTGEIRCLEKELASQRMDPDYIRMAAELLSVRLTLLMETAQKDKSALEEEFRREALELEQQQKEIEEQIQAYRRKLKFLLGNIRRMSKEAEAGQGRRRPELKVLENKKYKEELQEPQVQDEAETQAMAAGMGNIDIKKPEKNLLSAKETEDALETREEGQREKDLKAEGPESAALMPETNAAVSLEAAPLSEKEEREGEEASYDFEASAPSEDGGPGLESPEQEAEAAEPAVKPEGEEINDGMKVPAEPGTGDEGYPETMADTPAGTAFEPEPASPWALRYRFLWGKKAGASLADSSGRPIIGKGEPITSQVVDKAVAAGALDRLVRDIEE